MAAGNSVDTAHVTGRRELHFTNLNQVLAEAERLAAADRHGKLNCLGNWTLGQNFNHLATWMQYSYDELPFKIPWLVRLIMRPMRKSVLSKPSPPGRRISKLPGGTRGIEPMSTADGLAKLGKNAMRLKAEPPVKIHPLFGKMNHQQWMDLHLRHAELHFSFVNTN